MPRVSVADRIRNRRRGRRGAQLRSSSSDDDVNAPIAPSNVVEKDPVVADHPSPPSATEPPSTTIQGAISTKKISAIRGWTKEDMLAAIDDIEFKGYSIRASAKKHGIAASNIHYWINGLTNTKRRGPVTVMTEEEEDEVVEWCKEMALLGHGLELIQLKSTVAQICQGRPNPFKDGFPGKSWWSGFKKRHPDLVLRTAEGLDRDRALNLRPAIVSKFYNTLSAAYDQHSYAPDHIWNCDETGLQAGRNCGMRVIAKRGSRNVPKILPKSREWITILACVNAIGSSIPGFYLFKGKTQLKNYIQNCEPGACMAAHPHAWMTKELFLNWLCHFAASVPGGVSPENRHLMILDGHGSHMAVQTIEEANKLGIDLLTLPAHTTHRLQPLDVSVFGPFKNYFRVERASWMAKNPGVEVKRFELAELASKAFKRALTPSNIKAGFRRTGIWPLNHDALMHDTTCSQAFEVEGQEAENLEEHVGAQEDVAAAEGIMSLSEGLFCGGDDAEHVSETQFSDEPTNNINEAVTPTDAADNEQLTMPTQVSAPSWLAEAVMNITGNNVSTTNEDESMDMPSQPSGLNTELVHYFVDNGSLEEEPIQHEVPEEDNNGGHSVVPEDEIQQAGLEKQRLLGAFLKLPVERVKASSRNSASDYLRLGRSSQLLTSEDYMNLMFESERKKNEIQEAKKRKKELANEKRVARIATAEARAKERLERQKAREEKEHQKQLARQQREARKVQQELEKGQGVTSREEHGSRQFEANRLMSNTLDHIAEQTPSFQDLINIQVPSYQAGVRPTSYTPTSAGLNPNCVYMTPAVSAGVSNTSGHLGYSVPPWLHGANWSQPYANIQAHPNHPMLGSPPYLGNAGNGSHQA